MVMIVAVPCHCLSLTLHNFYFGPLFCSIITLSELKVEHNVAVVIMIALLTTRFFVLLLSYLFLLIIPKGQ